MGKLLELLSGILLVLCGTTLTNGQKFRSDYISIANGWIKYHTIPQTWDEAVLTCLYEGAILASPLNEGIKDALILMMLKHELNKAPIFTGIHNKYSEYFYQSMEGVPLTDMAVKWSNVPSGKSSCVVMGANSSIAEGSCEEKHNFACYKNEPEGDVTECGTVDNGYKLSNETESCYKVHEDMQDWSTAYRVCAAEGGHLAIINSQAEAEVIKELARKYSPLYESISIGFRSWNKQKTWMTIHGETLEAAGYSKWSAEEPNNATNFGPGEYCGGVIVKFDKPADDGILNDVSCHHGYMFICEMKPNIVPKYYDLPFKYIN